MQQRTREWEKVDGWESKAFKVEGQRSRLHCVDRRELELDSGGLGSGLRQTGMRSLDHKADINEDIDEDLNEDLDAYRMSCRQNLTLTEIFV